MARSTDASGYPANPHHDKNQNKHTMSLTAHPQSRSPSRNPSMNAQPAVPASVVQQFRTEPLDLDAFKTAREALGPVVPEATALEVEELLNEGAWAYSLTRLYSDL